MILACKFLVMVKVKKGVGVQLRLTISDMRLTVEKNIEEMNLTGDQTRF